jgi:hypothetical protein
MLRAPHHDLGLVQSTRWATVGHVVAAAAAQAQASDDDAARMLSLAPHGTLCNRLSICFYRPSLLYYLLVFPSCPSFFLSYLFRCALLWSTFLCPASKSVVVSSFGPSFLSLISVFVYIRWRSQNALPSYHISDFLWPPVRTSEREITCSGRTGARTAYYRPLLLLSPVVDRRGI